MRLRAALIAASTAALVAAVLVPAAAEAAPTKYYVDCSAKTAGTGTVAQPWNRLAQIHDHGDFAPGDTISLRRGTTCHGQLHPSGSGAPGAPITLGAYGTRGAKPTVSGDGTPNYTGAVQLRNQPYWIIQDLRVTNTRGGRSTQVYRSGVSVWNQDGGEIRGVIIQRLEVEDVASSPNEKFGSSREWGGITVSSGGVQGDSFPGLVIRDNRVDRVGRSGIAVMNWEFPTTFNEGVRITGNRVSWARGDGIVVFGAQHSRIDHNVVANAADEWPCPLCGSITPLTANAGIWPARSSHIRIDHNEVYGTHWRGGDGEAFDSDQDTHDVVFEYNYAHDNTGGGILFCGSRSATVRFNIFENNDKGAFTFIGNVPADGTSIYNNTVFVGKQLKQTKVVRAFNVDKGPGGGTVAFKNNVYFNYSTYRGGWWQWNTPAVTTAANTIIGVHGAGRPHDRSTSRKDPHLRKPGSGGIGFASLNGYRLQKGKKPQRGVAIPADVTRDFFGRRIDPKHPPRGAVG
ncbi:right-handed parallel beta-helix repeat-containing protein [Amnibacterium kyonggiense]|uniref:Parallel beta helix pectate lyase-like protein n=1 Tax=Amnibacterium kyonggiense TaxID=595671 RepID=A0A4R7FH32_9MICO|nr:right-handed parallel beta-helix repeat-containing protein [Amnibacterium kyonggiense]TDS74970.1 parallel beta helix pectate lyase-like protein [Amnibacterium kyonggiense]